MLKILELNLDYENSSCAKRERIRLQSVMIIFHNYTTNKNWNRFQLTEVEYENINYRRLRENIYIFLYILKDIRSHNC